MLGQSAKQIAGFVVHTCFTDEDLPCQQFFCLERTGIVPLPNILLLDSLSMKHRKLEQTRVGVHVNYVTFWGRLNPFKVDCR